MPISTGLNGDKIRVGIILGEDRQESVALSWRPGQLLASSTGMSENLHEVRVTVHGASLRVQDDTSDQTVERLVLRTSDDVHSLTPGAGITVNPVRTGRGFHWQKDITVTLPGELIVEARDGCLVLVNQTDVESYVACVATSEMGSAAPTALLGSQTVVARCWALALAEKKHESDGFDVCNDDCCQRYQGTTFVTPASIEAARDTAGQVMVYDNGVIDARYSKNCGGIVEDYTAVWGGSEVPYLIPLWDAPDQNGDAHFHRFAEYFEYDRAFCAPARFQNVDLEAMLGKVDVSGSYYRWTYDVAVAAIIDNLRRFAGVDWNRIDDIEILERGASARITRLVLKGLDVTGSLASHTVEREYNIRQLFSESFLYSAAFEILNANTFSEDGRLRLRGCGWGHGAGLCQMGALGMALAGYSVKDILTHYYPGAEFRSMRSQRM